MWTENLIKHTSIEAAMEQAKILEQKNRNTTQGNKWNNTYKEYIEKTKIKKVQQEKKAFF